ncbi:hypothetical protein Pcinc_017596 [Petrolisthes cinctipes]|uniref:ubiquitinyl hydrolase 1 n=1 Tax=Petrolisthes cinctipes TaxID=88211 RepID=A0AAE1FNY2_PETCI|nr:hypothetical protein Pcinc_017596 [Petrolisthes cinctipes]
MVVMVGNARPASSTVHISGERKRRCSSTAADDTLDKSMEPANKKTHHQTKQDVGSSTKKKKDRENRNSISCELAHDWSQKNEFVTVSVIVGHGHDNRTVNINTDETTLAVSLAEGRKFSAQLFAPIVPEATSVTYKGPRCIIKLLKHDNTVHWPHLEVAKKPSPEKIVSQKNKTSSPSQTNRTPEKKQQNQQHQHQQTQPLENDTIENEDQDKLDNGKASCLEDGVVTTTNVKVDYTDRDAESRLSVFLYIKNINKDVSSVSFTEDSISAKFQTSDPKFLQQHPGTTEETWFEWNLNLKDKVVSNECHYKVTANNMEIKLKKQTNKKWGSLTNVVPESAPSSKVAKNTWMAASKSDTSPTGLGTIPLAPPIPPSLEAKKPMCLVSPVSKGMRGSSSSFSTSSSSSSSSSSSTGGCEGPVTPVVPRGTTGLENIGNTCFMNSVLQCLANTQELREYFLDYNYQEEINKDNPLGMGGKLAGSFAQLMKVLWSGTQPSIAPMKLKSMMSVKANQFSGFAQHDAQEFMVELLDGMHEDLNRVKKKPYMAEPPDLDGWDDKRAADEWWRLHKLRNDSIIDDLFKGQFKSTLTCHECDKVSVKFDEFCCLSVPIPKDQKLIQVIFFWKDPYQKPKKFFIRVPANASIEELKNELCDRTGVTSMCIQVFEMYKSKIHKIFSKGSSLSSVVPSDTLMAFEVYNRQQQLGEAVVEIAVVQRMMTPNPPSRCAYCSRSAGAGTKLRRCTKCFSAGYCHQACQKNHWTTHKPNCKLLPDPVGCPFVVSLPKSHATYSRLARIMEAYARYSVDVFQPPVYHSSSSPSSHRGSTSSIELSGEENDSMEVEDGVEAENKEELGDVMMSGDGSLQSDCPTNWVDQEGGAVGGDSAGEGGGSGGSSDEPPQLSTSPSVRAVQPRGMVQLPPATQLFVMRPVNNRALNLAGPAGESLQDKGDEPLDLNDKYYIAMDWKTNERQPVHCLVQNKEVECEVEGSYSVQRNQPTTLDACIELFTQPENLSEGDSWRCPRCKKPVEATKQMSVWRLPHILIIQLKRFSFKYVLYSDKIDKFVQYPVRGLNLQPYMSVEPEDGPATYDLFGVINHMGRLLGGHYTAYARLLATQDTRRSEIDWRFCDDSRVNFCPESRVVNEQAYLLLYRRRDTPFSLHRSLAPPHTPEENGTDGSMIGVGAEAEEVTPMSISSISQLSSSSQPSSSSLEGEEPLSTAQEELD